MNKTDDTRLAIFNGKKIRKIIHKKEWWFSIIDVVEVLTGTDRPRKYWSDLKNKLNKEGYIQLSENIGQLKMPSPDGKMRSTDCANTETLLRIIQSIPSKIVEPLKRWLARVGKERIDEIENPELSMERMKELYEKKEYPKDWIDKRVRGIAVRQDLTSEWKNRGLSQNIEYTMLTNEIMHGTFGLTVDQYKNIKGLTKQNLRDHMDDIELILTMLGEATTSKFTKDRDSKGFHKLKKRC
ncbi:BRO family protein [Candidatus Margulisiibacteriota bacterium]